MSALNDIYSIISDSSENRQYRSQKVSDALARSLSIDDLVRMTPRMERRCPSSSHRWGRGVHSRKVFDKKRHTMNDTGIGYSVDPSKFAEAFRRMGRGEQPGGVTEKRSFHEELERRRTISDSGRTMVKDDDFKPSVYSVQTRTDNPHIESPETDYNRPYDDVEVETVEADNSATIADLKLLDLLFSNFRDLGQRGFLEDVCPTTVECIRNLASEKDFEFDVEAILAGVKALDPRAESTFCEKMLDYKDVMDHSGISSLFLTGLENTEDTYLAIKDLFYPEYEDTEEEVQIEAEEALLDEDEDIESLEDVETLLAQIISEAQLSDSSKQTVHDNIIRRYTNGMMRKIKDDALKEAARESSILTELEEYLKNEIAEDVITQVAETYDLEEKDEDDEEDDEEVDFDMDAEDVDFDMDESGEGDDFFGDDDFGGDADFDMDAEDDSEFDFDMEESEGDGADDFVDFDSDTDEGGFESGEDAIKVDQVAELAKALVQALTDKKAASDSVNDDALKKVIKGVSSVTARPIGDSAAQSYIPVSKEDYASQEEVANLIETTFLMGKGLGEEIKEAEVCGSAILANKSTNPTVFIARPSVEVSEIEEVIANGDTDRLRDMCVPLPEVQKYAVATNTLCALDEGFYKSNPLSSGWDYDEKNEWLGSEAPASGTVYPGWQELKDSVDIKINGVPFKVVAKN